MPDAAVKQATPDLVGNQWVDLPWRVQSNGRVVAAFGLNSEAKDWIKQQRRKTGQSYGIMIDRRHDLRTGPCPCCGFQLGEIKAHG